MRPPEPTLACPHCRYDLAGIADRQLCPECGGDITQAAILLARKAKLKKSNRLRAFFMISPLAGALLWAPVAYFCRSPVEPMLAYLAPVSAAAWFWLCDEGRPETIHDRIWLAVASPLLAFAYSVAFWMIIGAVLLTVGMIIGGIANGF